MSQLDGDRAEPVDLDRFARHVRGEHLPHALIVDCSASAQVAAHYPRWLAAGIHVVTPNKHAGSGAWEHYAAIQDAGRRGGGRFRYEATVGAGLPVMLTLRNLLDTGDELIGIDGMLSGTLAWLFNRYDGSAPFSQLVREAQALGYTEPDPRDDLSGLDVARKLVILAREAGRALSLEDVEVENLVPLALRDVSRDEFLARLDEMDAPMQARYREAARAATLAASPGPTRPRRPRQRRRGRAAARPCLLPHAPDRQPGAIPHAPLRRQPAGGAGPRRGSGRHRGRRVRRRAGDRAVAGLCIRGLR